MSIPNSTSRTSTTALLYLFIILCATITNMYSIYIVYKTPRLIVNMLFFFSGISYWFAHRLSISNCSLYLIFGHISQLITLTAPWSQSENSTLICVCCPSTSIFSATQISFYKKRFVDWCLPQSLHGTLAWAWYSFGSHQGLMTDLLHNTAPSTLTAEQTTSYYTHLPAYQHAIKILTRK